MELGALVCLPNGAPECDRCPAAGFCVAYRENKTALLPVKGAKKSRTIENRTVYLLFYNGKVALRRRPAGACWRGCGSSPTSWRRRLCPINGGCPHSLRNSAAPAAIFSPTGSGT